MYRRAIVAFACLAALIGCGDQGSGGPARTKARGADLAGKKALFIIAARNFRDEELAKPAQRLKSLGCSVTIASTTLDEITGMRGAKVRAEVLLKDVKAADYDAVVFVGGVGAAQYFDDPTAHAIAREAAEKGKVLAAICLAPSILARANLLRGKRATAWKSQKDDLVANGATWSPGPIERDGKVLTANGPQAAEVFGQMLARALAESARP